MRLARTGALLAVLALLAPAGTVWAAPTGQLTWGVHISLAPTYFDPAETPGLITPFMVLYAVHDAQPFAPSLAESWTQAHEGYWRKRGEVDIVYSITGPLAEELKRSQGLSLRPTYMPFTGYPNGFGAGELGGDMIDGTGIGEPAANHLNVAGIRVRLHLREWAAYYAEYGDAFGKAATRLETYIVGGGRYVYDSAPDIEGLFAEQVNEGNPRVRQQLLHKIQQMVHERALAIPALGPVRRTHDSEEVAGTAA